MPNERMEGNIPHLEYVSKEFSRSSQNVIAQANLILSEYADQGYDLTLRQLYYQFVSRDLLPNTQQAYKRLGSIVSDARLAGLVDWDAIVDRTRNVRRVDTWTDPESILSTAADSYKIDLWERQPVRIEVWIEKDALIGVIERPCMEFRVPHFSCRGFVSQSEMWSAGRRMMMYRHEGHEPIVIHLGDHDPSGIDMTRDIRERLEMFSEGNVKVSRIALNMDQVEKYDPPPNPAKMTDSRARGYVTEYDYNSWELDALEPNVLSALIKLKVSSFLDQDKWADDLERESVEREEIRRVAGSWDEAVSAVQ